MRWALLVVGSIAGLIALVAIVGAMLPQKHVATRTVRIEQPREAIFAVVNGPPNWRPDVESFEELPPRDGHRTWREVDKHGNAILFEAVEEVAPSRLVTRIADPKLPFGGNWTIELRPDSGGTVVQVTENGEVYNPIFRFMSKFVFGHTATIDAYLNALAKKFN